MENDIEFRLMVSYSQIAVFNSGIENPLNDWTAAHVSQGFAWREGSVSFSPLEAAGGVEVSVRIQSRFQGLQSETIRAIRVPFTVGKDVSVEIASVADSQKVDVPAGFYDLIFESGYTGDREMWCRFSFVSEATGEFVILRADEELNPPMPLVTDARPAE